MTGAVLAVLINGGTSGGGGGGIINPGPTPWSNIYTDAAGSTQLLAMTVITAPITISITRTGAAQRGYILNGISYTYTGPFMVQPGDQLGFFMINNTSTPKSGVVTVTNVTASTTLATFNYVLTGNTN